MKAPVAIVSQTGYYGEGRINGRGIDRFQGYQQVWAVPAAARAEHFLTRHASCYSLVGLAARFELGIAAANTGNLLSLLCLFEMVGG
jgi:hypothetical protein